VTTPLGQLHQGRDAETAHFKLTNELRRFAYPRAGTAWCIASENISAFNCVAPDPDTDTIVLARADGTNYAVGVIGADVRVGELAQVVTCGIVEGAVSGRTAGDTVWVGADGTLVFTPPTGANYVETIAVCVNATDIFVDADAPGLRDVLQSFQFTIMINNSADGLVVDPYWIAPANADGETDIDAIDERGWPYAGRFPAHAFSFYVKCFDGDGFVVDSGVWQWDFELLKNGVTSLSTVTITSGGAGSQTASDSGTATFSPGDHVGVRVVGSQVSGASTTGALFAFVSVALQR
jgi:hypothetical protein